MDNSLLSVVDAAAIANCHHDTIRRAITTGYLKAQRVGKAWIITKHNLDEWINRGKPNRRRKSARKTSETEDLSDS